MPLTTNPVFSYASTDSSAPVLTGTRGDLVNLLDKCLVTGYGSKAAVGWTKPFSTTNKAAFRMKGGSLAYLRVDETVSISYGDKASHCRGYLTMSDVDTGTNVFPTADFCGIKKSNTADATARPWYFVADDRFFILAVKTGESDSSWVIHYYGDIIPFDPADSTPVILGFNRSTSQNPGTTIATTGHAQVQSFSTYQSGLTGQSPVMATKENNGASVVDPAPLLINQGLSSGNPATAGFFGSALAGNRGIASSYPVSGLKLIERITVAHNVSGVGIIRGIVPGLFAPMHSQPFTDEHVFRGVMPFTGAGDFLALNIYSVGQVVIQTAGQWR